MSSQTTYPVGQDFAIGFNPVEDRLVLTTDLKNTGPTTLLLTRRMVLLTLSQIVNRLPALTGLEQTPVSYWKEVLAITHQQAVEQHRQKSADAKANPKAPIDPTPEPAESATATGDESEAESQSPADPPPSTGVFLATELTGQQAGERLHLAFKGFPVTQIMQIRVPQAPVLALSLEATHAHQLLQLLLTQATKANWHLPVHLPWLDAKGDQSASGVASH